MPYCELLLPPLQLSDRLAVEVGEQVLLGDVDAEKLALAGVVRIIGGSSLPPVVETPAVEQPLTDPELVEESPAEVSPAEPRTGLDLNAATEADLIALPGVGRAIAQRIIKNRPYVSLEELKVDADLTDNQFSALLTSEVFV